MYIGCSDEIIKVGFSGDNLIDLVEVDNRPYGISLDVVGEFITCLACEHIRPTCIAA